jgi:hypothetical protein
MPKEKEAQVQGQEETRRPHEEWAAQKGTPAWLLAAIRVKAGWALGQEVTEREYDQAVEAALKEVIR